MRSGWEQIFIDQLADLRAHGRYRSRRVVRPTGPVTVEYDGRSLVNFSSNDYLGLSHHPRVTEAAVAASKAFGVGSGAAPLITGYTPAHASAEAAIARWKQTESAVLFSSGYQANHALIQSLADTGQNSGRSIRFLLDKLCHASLIDAVRAVASDPSTGSTYRVFPHNGVEKLARLLRKGDPLSEVARIVSESANSGLEVIVTESIFSMDGDTADLTKIASLKTHQSLLVVDEAHGSGVFGPDGRGLAAELGLSHLIDATILTLSKAVGVIGAAVCGSKAVCETLVNRGRGYLFSTSMPAAMAAAAEASIEVMRTEPERQLRVRNLAAWVRRELRDTGIAIPPGDSPIIPIVLGSEGAALTASAELLDAGLLVIPIRPPTVPPGTSRLRITLSCEHSDAHIETMLRSVKRAAQGP